MHSLLIHRFFRLLPPAIREKLKATFAATGHRKSMLDKMRASSHALGKKRIDLVAQTLIKELKRANIPSLMQKRCMEFGAGYVPTELLIYLALGAKEVVGVDYNRIASLAHLSNAIDSAPHSWESELVELLGHSTFNSKRIIQNPQRNAINPYVGLDYIAPFDMSINNFADEPFDFIHSVSVLEHLPIDAVDNIIYNLFQSLKPGGYMINTIDLTDHWDADESPFGFLSANTDYLSEKDSDTRGNRLRLSEWLTIFSKLPDCNTICLASRSRPLGFPLTDLREEFKSFSMEELCFSEVTLLTTRSL
jgi:SAM-dependent methyltransferase